MKNKLIYLFAAVLMLTSCDLKEDHKFELSPDERLGAILDEYNNALVSSPNGWILSIDTKVGGGYQLYMNFNDQGRVTMLSDQEATYARAAGSATTPKESSWIIRGLQMPSLLFDTYNYLHALCDPTGSANGGANGTGMATDFEFDILRYDGGVFYLRGIFNKVYGYLRQATAEEAEAIMNGGLKDVHTRFNDYFNAMNVPALGNEEKVAQLSTDGRNIYITYLEDNEFKEASVSCYLDVVADENGVSNVKFFEPLNFLGAEITGLKWTEDGYQAISNEQMSVYDNGVPPFPLNFGPGGTFNCLTFTTYDDYVGTMSDKYYETYYKGAAQSFLSRRMLSWTCSFIKNDVGVPVFRINIANLSGTTTYYSIWDLTYTINEDGSITFTDRVESGADGNKTNARSYGRYMRTALDIFCTVTYSSYTYSSSTNYNIVVDQIVPHTFRPDWVPNNTPGLTGNIGALVDVDDPDMFFCGKLSKVN